MTEIDPNYELIEKYINGFMWSSDTPEITKTIVAANIRAFYGWSQENLVNDRADRLEGMVDRLAEKNVELQEYRALYEDVAKLLNTANYKLSQISQLASRERANTGLQADWATVAVCPDCKPDYDVEQTMCISCGRPTAKA